MVKRTGDRHNTDTHTHNTHTHTPGIQPRFSRMVKLAEERHNTHTQHTHTHRYSTTLFAYGQTGSGKTYSISGAEDVIVEPNYSGGDPR